MIRRLLYFVPILLGAALIFFLIFNVVGGQDKYLYNLLPQKARTFEQIERYKHQYGLDRPLIVQYFEYVKQMVTFDFGRSQSRKLPVDRLIKRMVPVSAILTFPAFIMEIAISLILAGLCAFFRGRTLDKFLTILSVLGMSVPMLVLIMLGQYILAYKLNLFPISGWQKGFGAIQYLILPWILWVTVSIGYDIRFFRTALLEEINKDYVRTSKAKGMSETQIMFRHVLMNAMIPILSYVVIQIPFLLTGSIMLERFFSIPGIGSLMVDSIFNYDLPVLKAIVLVYTLFFVVFSLVTDVLYALVDPRIRLS
ncbi:ABC transporter permease [Spirochaeta cellobiosiphila]|uniref:ABC transporter permease n=1 Tax=Spirochaeta cellobiosiphila TaxID=504483 RepID=UPI001B7FC751|nr:ABC transporter permease [Spirochaeta cellobiosiphila]